MYTKAAEQGNTDAQFNLGYMYATGQGVTQNDELAHMWLNLAATEGDEEARRQRDLLAAQMTAEQINQAQRDAAQRRSTYVASVR